MQYATIYPFDMLRIQITISNDMKTMFFFIRSFSLLAFNDVVVFDVVTNNIYMFIKFETNVSDERKLEFNIT